MEQESSDDVTASRMDRRTAMKAALGGAAAAAAFSAPRIEGFSLAPDYAAASSGTTTTTTTTTTAPCTSGAPVAHTKSTEYNAGKVATCWGHQLGGTVYSSGPPCGPAAFGPLNVAPGMSLSGSIDGRLNEGGTVTYNVSGLSATHSCTVTVNGECNVGDFTGAKSQTFNASGAGSTNIKCNGWAVNGSVTVGMTCICV